MTKKEKQLLKEEFENRMKGKVCMVNGSGWSIPLDEYMEQERWRRKSETFVPEPLQKREYPPENPDTGILSPECLFETKLWYIQDKYNRNLQLRNERRRSK